MAYRVVWMDGGYIGRVGFMRTRPKCREEPIRRSVASTMGTRGTNDGYMGSSYMPLASMGGRITYCCTAVLTLFLESSLPGPNVNGEHLPALCGGLSLLRPLGIPLPRSPTEKEASLSRRLPPSVLPAFPCARRAGVGMASGQPRP